MDALSFDFITNESFRNSLQADYRDMVSCSENRLAKPVYVLAGSIVEALLIEYLVATPTLCNGKDPLKLDLGGAIETCEKGGVLTRKTASLCEVIRDYRNLIHPGRQIRLKEKVSEEGARIAVALVTIISGEIEEKRKENYGLTAEQIVHKLGVDKLSMPLIPYLLKEANEHERGRLVNDLLPQAYSKEAAFFPDEDTLARIKSCYRLALDSLSQQDRKLAAERFAKMIREASADLIQSYGDAFFTASDMARLGQKDIPIVKEYLLARLDDLKKGMLKSLAGSLGGIGPYLENDEEVGRFMDPLIRVAMYADEQESASASQLIKREFNNASDYEKQQRFETRADSWVKFGSEKGYPDEKLAVLKGIADDCLAIPF
jgi:hypothetical protein